MPSKQCIDRETTILEKAKEVVKKYYANGLSWRDAADKGTDYLRKVNIGEYELYHRLLNWASKQPEADKSQFMIYESKKLKETKMKYKITKIDYDYDQDDLEGDDPEYSDLILSTMPQEIIVEVEDEDDIADEISNKTGWLVNGFESEPLLEMTLQQAKKIVEAKGLKLKEGRPTEQKDRIRNMISTFLFKGNPKVQLVSIGSGRWSIAEVDPETGGQKQIIRSKTLSELDDICDAIRDYNFYIKR